MSASAVEGSGDVSREVTGAADLARQVGVAVSAVIAVVGTAIGVGAFGGTTIQDAGGGAFSADATLVAPAGPAFSIWTPIYVGLVAYAVWQLAPRRRAAARQRRVGWLVAATMLLNAAWILTVQAGAVAASVGVIAVLLLGLVAVYARLLASAPSSRLEAVVLDGTMGLYLGWVSIATVANAAAALVDAGVDRLVLGATVWAALMLAVAAVIGVVVAFAGRGRLAFGLALGWGLAWVSVGRLDGASRSVPVVVVAAVAAVVVLAATVAARRSSRQRPT